MMYVSDNVLGDWVPSWRMALLLPYEGGVDGIHIAFHLSPGNVLKSFMPREIGYTGNPFRQTMRLKTYKRWGKTRAKGKMPGQCRLAAFSHLWIFACNFILSWSRIRSEKAWRGPCECRLAAFSHLWISASNFRSSLSRIRSEPWHKGRRGNIELLNQGTWEGSERNQHIATAQQLFLAFTGAAAAEYGVPQLTVHNYKLQKQDAAPRQQNSRPKLPPRAVSYISHHSKKAIQAMKDHSNHFLGHGWSVNFPFWHNRL